MIADLLVEILVGYILLRDGLVLVAYYLLARWLERKGRRGWMEE